MGLCSGGSVVVAVSSPCDGGKSGWAAVIEGPLGGGGDGGHTANPVTGDLCSGSLATNLGARVLVGHPCAPTWILTMRLGAGLSGELSTGMISTGSSSSSSSETVTPSPPSLRLGDESSIYLNANG
jgi:hypothetical protein